MPLFKRKSRPENDPRYEYMVGRLVGASELMSLYMYIHGDSEARDMAERVHVILSFFMKEHPDKSAAIKLPPRPRGEEDTLILSPKEVEAYK
jgi:hypothetical protein